MAQQTAKREGTLRHQLDAAQWALSKQQREAYADGVARLSTQIADATKETSSREYYLQQATDSYYTGMRQRAQEAVAARTRADLHAADAKAPPPVTPHPMPALDMAASTVGSSHGSKAQSPPYDAGSTESHEVAALFSPLSQISPSKRAAEAASRAAEAAAALARAHSMPAPYYTAAPMSTGSITGLEAAAASAVAAMRPYSPTVPPPSEAVHDRSVRPNPSPYADHRLHSPYADRLAPQLSPHAVPLAIGASAGADILPGATNPYQHRSSVGLS